ncbi:MAG: DUF362 domain-containing protein [Syntrophomonas sp.]
MNGSGLENKAATVALVKCSSYECAEVKEAVAKGLELIGGADSLFRPGEKILLKPNLLTAEPPEKCVTTHPAVFKAVAEALMKTGIKLVYGDSPGLGSTEKVARKAGIMNAAEELGIELADFKKGGEVVFDKGMQNKKFVIAQGVLDCDGVVSLPKFKTHGLTMLTGAIKNQFGCIPGVLKGEFHVKLPRLEDFARMLVDLNCLLRPRLFVMDAVMAMEGNGPRSGNPHYMGVLLFSTDPVALDATAGRLVGVRPDEVPTLKYGQESGLGVWKSEDIEIVGDSLAELRVEGFVRGKKAPDFEGGSQRLRNFLVPRPRIKAEECVQCGICREMCPLKPSAVDWIKDGKSLPPAYNYDRCIRCYCCQELCPEGAIEIYTPWAGRLLAPLRPRQ